MSKHANSKKAPKHCIRRGTKYSFRFVLPADVRHAFDNKPQLVTALGTDSWSEAESKALALHTEWARKVDIVRSGGFVVQDIRNDLDRLLNNASRCEMETFVNEIADEALAVIREQLDRFAIAPPAVLSQELAAVRIQFGIPEDATQGGLRRSLHLLAEEIVHMAKVVAVAVEDPLAVRFDAKTQRHTFEPAEQATHTAKMTGITHTEANGLTLRKFIELTKTNRGVSVRERYESILTHYLELDAPLTEQFSRESINGVLSTMQSEGKAFSTASTDFSHIKWAAKVAHGDGYIQANPAASIKLRKGDFGKGRSKNHYDAASLGALWTLSQTISNGKRASAAALRFLIATGARMGEVLGLDGTCFAEHGGVLCCQFGGADAEHGRVKNDTSRRWIPLPQLVLEDAVIMGLVEKARKDGGLVFSRNIKWNKTTGFVGSLSAWFSTTVKAKAVRAGLDMTNRTAHMFRDAFISQWDVLKLPSADSERFTGHARSDISAVHRDYIADRVCGEELAQLKEYADAVNKTVAEQLCV